MSPKNDFLQLLIMTIPITSKKQNEAWEQKKSTKNTHIYLKNVHPPTRKNNVT